MLPCKRLADGISVNNGIIYHLPASNWLIYGSPPSKVDAILEPKSELPRVNELDFALLRVAEAPGASKLGPNGPVRGWIEIPAVPYDFTSSQALFIMQHPKETPLQLVLDTAANIRVNANGTRVTYRTNTDGGSSGSPCFSMNWDLIALHHTGDPDWNPSHKPVYNQGIPISAIHRLLEEKNVAGVLDGG